MKSECEKLRKWYKDIKSGKKSPADFGVEEFSKEQTLRLIREELEERDCPKRRK